MNSRRLCLATIVALSVTAVPIVAQQQPANRAGRETAATAPVVVPPDYVVGPSDVLEVIFWREKEMSIEAVVRPDGYISLPLLHDIRAAGLTPAALRDEIAQLASKFIEDPNATVVVKAIHSRKVFITGNIDKPGEYPLTSTMNVMQLIAVAGGLQEHAKSSEIVIMRTTAGRQQHLKFNYKDVVKQKNVQQNVTLQPGDTVVVP